MFSVAPILFVLAVQQQNIPLATLAEEMRIVSNDAAIGTSLTAIMSGTVLSDGRILLVHRQEGVIRVFDASGRFVTMFGRKGDGPGEFREPFYAGTLGDTIWVMDVRGQLRRFTMFTRDFKYIRTLEQPSGQDLGPISSTAALNKTGVDSATVVAVYDANRQLIRRFPITFRSNTHRFEVRDPGRTDIGPARGGGSASSASAPPQPVRMVTVQSPLAARTEVASVPGGREIVILEPGEVWGGRPGQFTMRRMSTTTGQITAPVTVSLPPRRVTPAAADSAISSYLSNRPQVTDEYRAKAKTPEYYPPFVNCQVDGDGLLWVREHSNTSSEIVVDQTGRPLMRVQFPDGMLVLARSRTHIWGSLRDANDLPIVLRYRIVAGRQ